jgi:hypothetical protein
MHRDGMPPGVCVAGLDTPLTAAVIIASLQEYHKNKQAFLAL